MRTLLIILATVAASPASAEENAAPTRFARIAHDAGGRPGALQVAIVRYSGRIDAEEITVDLIGAVHIGDEAYYESLNERFRQYDALLFELVIPEQTGTSHQESQAGGASLLTGTQIGLKNLLGLTFQLDEIDYGAANFVHADLTSDSLAESMAERGESLYVYFWRTLYAAIEDYTRDPLGVKRSQRLAGALNAGSGHALKTAMAYEMTDAARAGDFLAGKNGSAIIDARNEHAMAVLDEQLSGGARHVGIFYGVAHMPDFERRLVEELALRRTGLEWTDAWRLDHEATTSPVR